MTPEAVLEMEAKMLRTFQAKEQREYFKEMMRQVKKACLPACLPGWAFYELARECIS